MNYTVKIAKTDSVTPVIYTGAKYIWWQRDVLAIEFGESGIDRKYTYVPRERIDHVHIIEENE